MPIYCELSCVEMTKHARGREQLETQRQENAMVKEVGKLPCCNFLLSIISCSWALMAGFSAAIVKCYLASLDTL